MSKRRADSTGNDPLKKQRVLDNTRLNEQTNELLDKPTEISSTHKNTLYVRNLNDKIKINTLRESLYMLFATYGEVIKVSISPKHRGQAFILFRTKDEANLALLSLKDELFFGKCLKLQFSKDDTKHV